MTEPRRDAKIAHLKPLLAFAAGRIKATLELEGHRPLIIETARSWARQRWLWEAGRTRSSGIGVTPERPLGRVVTNAMPGGSYHTPDENGHASACDWFWQHPDPWSLDRPWDRLGELAEAEGLVWGGRWASRDFGHVQLPGPLILEV